MTHHDPTFTTRVVLGTAFTGAGIAHLVKNEWFEGLVPEYLARWRKPLSFLTGVLQIVGGIALFLPRLRVFARWANIGLYVPTLIPAFGQMKTPEVLRSAGIPPALAPVRGLVQMVVIGMVWRCTRPGEMQTT